jgi:DNA-binding CsgD family transcriptional regulator
MARRQPPGNSGFAHWTHSGALRRETDAAGVIGAAADTLRATVPADMWCAVLLDPSTLLDTGGKHEHGYAEELIPRLLEIEHIDQTGVDNLRALSRRADPVSLLSLSVRGDMDSSVYFRDIMRPAGMADEMRVLLREGGLTWGLLVLGRTPVSPPFTARDLAAARALAGPATAALRRSLVATGADTGTIADGTGMVLLDRDQRLVQCSSTAELLLTELPEGPSPDGDKRCPYSVRAVATAARVMPDGEGAYCRVRTRAGRWLKLHGWHLPGDEQLTIVAIGPADPGTLVALVLDAYNLSARQRQVAQLILLGRPTNEILARLYITRDTLNDHLAKIFNKIGVNNRRELVAEIFARHYQPNLGAAPLDLDGRLFELDRFA